MDCVSGSLCGWWYGRNDFVHAQGYGDAPSSPAPIPCSRLLQVRQKEEEKEEEEEEGGEEEKEEDDEDEEEKGEEKEEEEGKQQQRGALEPTL